MTEERFAVVDIISKDIISAADFYLMIYETQRPHKNNQSLYELGVAVWNGRKILVITDNIQKTPETLLRCASQVFLHDLSTQYNIDMIVHIVRSYIQNFGVGGQTK